LFQTVGASVVLVATETLLRVGLALVLVVLVAVLEPAGSGFPAKATRAAIQPRRALAPAVQVVVGRDKQALMALIILAAMVAMVLRPALLVLR
jgi:hypothetical protein